MNWTTLVSAQALAATVGDADLVLVDCRFVLGKADAGEQAWRQAHLPGAGYADLDRDLSDHRKPASLGRHPMPEAADLCAVLERLGITPEHQVLAYDAGDGAMAAARFWWLLRLLGHARVAVLDGGMARWQSLGLPLESTTPVIRPGRYDAGYDLAQVAGADEVMSRLGESPGWLLDARAPERFRGEIEPLDPVAGHIPGACNRPFAHNLADGRFLPPSQLRLQFEALLAGRDPREVLLSCGSGVTACHNLLAMDVAGLPGARVYAGSWSGWVSDRSRPMATGA
jgi:thiosulfate/3-mercaptopyruvate sulfurtransferase